MYFRWIVTCLLLLASYVAESKPPNIVLITADDMGFDDLSLNNHPFIRTPNLDVMAQRSVQFSDFSVTPVCSTTRAALLTGRDFYKTGVSGVHGGRDFMHLSETLISGVLQSSGYKTGTWGKWHLGKTQGYFPWNRGFDQGYYAELYRHENSTGYLNGEPVQHDKWVSEVVTDYAINFIDANKSQPFFAYLSYLAPHEPWLAPDEFVQPLIKEGLRPAIANLYGMVNEMDFHIGRLIQHLKQQQLLDNTIIIFLSDNGPWWDSSNFGAMTKQEWNLRNPSNMNGNKGQTWQNAIRSPLFIHWPKSWSPSKVNRYVDVKDIFPTIVDVSHSEIKKDHKKIDGHSLIEYLQGNTTGPNLRETYIGSHDVVSTKHNFNQWTPIDNTAREQMNYDQQIIGLRTEQYKLLLNPSVDRNHYPSTTDGYVMFDMNSDPLERVNIYKTKPQVAQQLERKLRNKFQQLKQVSDTFRPPVYQITNNRVSVVNGFGPSKTTGNTLSKAHKLAGLKTNNDAAEYKLNVTSTGKYRIYIKQNSHDSVGINIKLSANDSSIEYEFDEQPIQQLGELTLPSGDVTMRLAVLSNNSMKPWSEISGLRRIYLVPADLKLDPSQLPIPN